MNRFYKASGGNIDLMFSSAGSVAGYDNEGPHFSLYTSSASGLIPLYQSYCDSCMDHLQSVTSNEHPLYTGQEVLGYCSTNQTGSTPKALVRLYSAQYSNHFVTVNQSEVDNVIASLGYIVEATICYVP